MEKLADLTLHFVPTNLEEINTLKTLNFLLLKKTTTKNIHIYSAYKELKDRGLKFLITDQNSPIKSYTVKLSSDSKFLTRFLNDITEIFIEQYTKEFDRKNVIFIRDINRKSGYIPFKFDLTKEYIEQFLLSFSSHDFNDFVFKSIRDKTATEPSSCIIGTDQKYLKASNSVIMYIDSRTLIRDKRLYMPPSSNVTPQILIPLICI